MIHSILAEEIELEQATAPDTITVETSYKGPHIQLPIGKKDLELLILAFQRGEVRDEYDQSIIEKEYPFVSAFVKDSSCSICFINIT